MPAAPAGSSTVAEELDAEMRLRQAENRASRVQARGIAPAAACAGSPAMSSQTGLPGLPARLRALRETWRLSQREMAETVGGSQRAWADYEAGRTMPGAAVLAGLAGRGCDLHWLLLGEGAMHRAAPQGLDEGLLAACLAGVERALAERGKALDAHKKALVVTEIYMLTQERMGGADAAAGPSEDLVARFVRLAS